MSYNNNISSSSLPLPLPVDITLSPPLYQPDDDIDIPHDIIDDNDHHHHHRHNNNNNNNNEEIDIDIDNYDDELQYHYHDDNPISTDIDIRHDTAIQRIQQYKDDEEIENIIQYELHNEQSKCQYLDEIHIKTINGKTIYHIHLLMQQLYKCCMLYLIYCVAVVYIYDIYTYI